MTLSRTWQRPVLGDLPAARWRRCSNPTSGSSEGQVRVESGPIVLRSGGHTSGLIELADRLPRTCDTPQRSRRMAEEANEALTHPVRVRETDGLRDGAECFASVFHPVPGHFHPEPFDCLCRGHSCRGKKRAAELSDAEMSGVRQLLDGKGLRNMILRE